MDLQNFPTLQKRNGWTSEESGENGKYKKQISLNITLKDETG